MAAAVSMVLVLVAALATGEGPALAGQTSVRFHEGLVSAKFDATSASEALDAIQRAIGTELVGPASVERKRLTLAVEQLPLERFLQRILSALDLGGFALVYGADGAVRQVIILDRTGGKESPTEAEPPPGGRREPLTGRMPALVWAEKPR